MQILEFDRRINAWHRSNEMSRRLDELPGVGPALATALVASVPDAKVFRSGRNFSAWIGLVPKQNSSGGKERLGNIIKQGDRYLRSLFTAGALAVIRIAKIRGAKHRPWLGRLLERRSTKVAAIALSSKRHCRHHNTRSKRLFLRRANERDRPASMVNSWRTDPIAGDHSARKLRISAYRARRCWANRWTPPYGIAPGRRHAFGLRGRRAVPIGRRLSRSSPVGVTCR